LTKAVLKEIDRAELITAPGCNLHLCIAIDYSSRDAIARAAASVTAALANSGTPSPDIVRPLLAQSLAMEHGEVDLLIRTGGEKRLSDFLLWESAYAELVFTDRMWPEFDETDLARALEEFRLRERRFGSVPATISQSAPSYP
jgi:undecaprenyl diphosphate synthase